MKRVPIALALMSAAGLFWGSAWCGSVPKPGSEEERLVRLEEEIGRLMDAMNQFEDLHNRAKYMEVLDLASQKNLEADEIWEKSQATKRGYFDGLQTGFFEIYSQRFPSGEKYSMLGKKYGLLPEMVRKIKSDIEILFAEEFAEKFTPPDEGQTQKK